MVINDGNHKEWPMPVVSDEILDKIERKLTMLFDKEHEEATWSWLLGQGPPQDDDIVWLKGEAYNLGVDSALSVFDVYSVLGVVPSQEEQDGLKATAHAKLRTL